MIISAQQGCTEGPPSSTRHKSPEEQPHPSFTSLIRAIPVCLPTPTSPFCLQAVPGNTVGGGLP